MATGLGCNVNESKGIPYDLNVGPVDDEVVLDCPICFEPLSDKHDDRTIVKLRCDHQFHLDCIGSAFNAKKKMQCPNCRNVEQGQWLYASGFQTPNFIVDDDWNAEEVQVDIGSFPDLVTSVPPFIGGLPGQVLPGPVVPSGQRHFGVITTDSWLTSYSSNQVLYDGFTRFDELGREHSLEMMRVQQQIEENVARIAANERRLHSIRYGGGQSSGSGVGGSREGGSGSRANGGGNINGGGSGSRGNGGCNSNGGGSG